MAPPDPAASKLIQPDASEQKPEAAPAPTEVAAAPAKPPEATEAELPAIAVQQTRFAIDLGGANSVDGLRALWRGLSKSHPEVAALRPIIMIKEGNNGLGMQLRLGAGPLINAAAAAKLCAGLAENRHCETTVFDGQRLSMRGSDKSQRQGPRQKPGQGGRQEPGQQLGEEPGLGAASRDRAGACARRQARQASPQLLLQALKARGARTGARATASSSGRRQAGDGVGEFDDIVVLQAVGRSGLLIESPARLA